MNIRAIKHTEIPQLIELCTRHAEYENAEYSPEGKVEPLYQALFKTKRMRCFVAEKNSLLYGYASVSKEWSTWDASEYLHLDCLYLSPEARGLGLGKRLIAEVFKHANRENIKLIQWQTPDFNKNAIEFYSHLGATLKQKARFYYPL